MSLNANTNLMINNQNNSYKTVKKQDNSQMYPKSQKSDTFQTKDKNITPAKIGLITGGSLVAVVLGDFILAKGKHIKKLFSKSENKFPKNESPKQPKDEPPKPPKDEQPKIEEKAEKPDNKENTPHIAEIQTIPAIKDVTKGKELPLKTYPKFEEARKDYLETISQENVDIGANAQELVRQLIPHNYSNDDSIISIMTRTKCTDFHSYAIDIKNNKMYIGNVLTSQSGITPRSPRNYSLNYLIKNLEDGRKLISIAVNTGRFNGGVGSRKSPQFINIVSNGTEFTPLQKDLIEIISQRKNIKPSSTKDVDIMSIGIYDPKKDGISGPQVCFELNKDILLSSIKTAKEQLKPDEIDREFVDKALNLAKGEKLERLE